MLSGVTVISTDLFVSATIIFSMTQSHPSLGGYYMFTTGRLTRICYNITTTIAGYTTTAAIGVTRNGALLAESEHIVSTLPQKGMRTYTTPIELAFGDTIAFYIRNVAFQPPNGVTSTATFQYFIHAVVHFDY